MASRKSPCGRLRSSAVSPISSPMPGALPRPSPSPAIATIAGSPSRWMTTGRASRPICATTYSSRSCALTTRAIRTKAAPDWGLQSRATSRARTAATSRSAIHRSAVCARPCACRFRNFGSVQPQLSDIFWIRLELTFLDAFDEVGEHGIGAAGQAELVALAHNEAVEELDLGAPALLHVLPHRGPLPGGGAAGVLDALLVAGAHRRLVAFAGARDRFRRNVQNFLELVAERLADADRFRADPRREAADRFALDH